MGNSFTQWPPFVVTSLRENLAALRVVTEDSDKNLEPEVRSWLARLLIVRSVGYIEQVVVECCREHVRQRSGGMVQNFAHSWLERSKNPSPENLAQLLGWFDQGLRDEFEDFLHEGDERLYRDLSFLVDRRNRIAHGLNEGIGAQRALELVDAGQDMVDWFILRLNPHR
jgi:RiboL-PSP-HEPN